MFVSIFTLDTYADIQRCFPKESDCQYPHQSTTVKLFRDVCQVRLIVSIINYLYLCSYSKMTYKFLFWMVVFAECLSRYQWRVSRMELQEKVRVHF